MFKKNQSKKKFQPRRIFSESVRRTIVVDIESGKCSVSQASQELRVTRNTIYRWIHRYSRYLKNQMVFVVEDKSQAYRTKELEQKLKELEAALGRKQLEIDFLNKLIEIAEKESGVIIKKNSSNSHLDGSNHKKANNTDTP
jgi:transposase-like protein